jgi:hypothetical protein
MDDRHRVAGDGGGGQNPAYSPTRPLHGGADLRLPVDGACSRPRQVSRCASVATELWVDGLAPRTPLITASTPKPPNGLAWQCWPVAQVWEGFWWAGGGDGRPGLPPGGRRAAPPRRRSPGEAGRPRPRDAGSTRFEDANTWTSWPSVARGRRAVAAEPRQPQGGWAVRPLASVGRQNAGRAKVCGVSLGGDSRRPIPEPVEVAEVVHGDRLAPTNDTRTPTLSALQNEAPMRPHGRLRLLVLNLCVDARTHERGVLDDVAHDRCFSVANGFGPGRGRCRSPARAEQNPPGPGRGRLRRVLLVGVRVLAVARIPRFCTWPPRRATGEESTSSYLSRLYHWRRKPSRFRTARRARRRLEDVGSAQPGRAGSSSRGRCPTGKTGF